MVKDDVKQVHKMLNKYLSNCKLNIQFSESDIAHFFLPRDNVIESFVVEKTDQSKGKITDFCSFYSLPSSILKHPNHRILNVAYSYYNVPGEYSLEDLMKQTLHQAKTKGYDVFNALDVQENEQVLKDLKFGVGDGNLHYYLYNWRVQKLTPQDLGVVLV